MLIPERNDSTPARLHLGTLLNAAEGDVLAPLTEAARFSPAAAQRVTAEAERLVAAARARPAGELAAWLREYGLSSPEGVALMCLAESLVRIPDAATAQRLVRDTLARGDWHGHGGHSPSALVNAATWALALGGRVLPVAPPAGALAAALARLGEPVVHRALEQAVRVLARHYVMGATMADALRRAGSDGRYRHSFDMLGEAARTMADAETYWRAYADAAVAIGAAGGGRGPVEGPGLSIKLSALHPRYEYAQSDRLRRELVPKVVELCRLARSVDIGLTIDAEEADRLELSLDVVAAVAAAVAADRSLRGWDGLGMAVQAYQTRAGGVIAWAADLARGVGRRLGIRLVKGAYWDGEIKRAQERGVARYPVFTRKAATDVSYLACARDLLAASDVFYPAFATHNAHTVAAVAELAGTRRDWEFQRLHGMGEALYDQLVPRYPCRVYAPVGRYGQLLPYLVRRLLENGANSSFVNQLVDDTVPAARLVADPLTRLAKSPSVTVLLPPDLYGAERRNARGWDLTDPTTLEDLRRALAAVPMPAEGQGRAVVDPADRRRVVGWVRDSAEAEVVECVNSAVDGQGAWDRCGGGARAEVLERAADLLEAEAPRLLRLLVAEAGKTLAEAVAELREAVDALRYYAAQARRHFAGPLELPAVTGESNQLTLHGRGVFACVSPWNFPLAIFVGQVAAALAAGNAVVAKAAEQTPLVAAVAVELLHRAGVPQGTLGLLCGDGRVGEALVSAPAVAGVAFTGSGAVARRIAQVLAAKDGPIVPLIAETGGLNAMVVDSSALAEQVVADVVASAFGMAGQRCSALRLLFVQADVADSVLSMLAGAVRELVVGDPADLATDVGPLIDAEALAALEAHRCRLEAEARLLVRADLPSACRHGTFFAPCVYELDRPEWLRHEVFGPCLHVVRYDADRVEEVVRWLHDCGYGLTLGIHSRIGSFVERIRAAAPVGNIYVNRSQIGAVIGCQPFGGEGLSGTGPKAGGPHTLFRYAIERTVTVNVTAAGGNAALLASSE